MPFSIQSDKPASVGHIVLIELHNMLEQYLYNSLANFTIRSWDDLIGLVKKNTDVDSIGSLLCLTLQRVISPSIHGRIAFHLQMCYDMEMAYELKNSSTHGFHGHLCLFCSVGAEDDKDFVKQDDMRANFKQSTDCVESFSRMGRLVIDGIDTVLHQTKYFDNKGGGMKNFVLLNRWQCCHLVNELSKMKVWLLQEHQN
jgi:hypothetical protein